MFEVENQCQEKTKHNPGASTTQQSDHDRLMEKLTRLETENRVLQGRIRGYKTLGDLLQEAREENKKLIEDKRKLELKIQTSPAINKSLMTHYADKTSLDPGSQTIIAPRDILFTISNPIQPADAETEQPAIEFGQVSLMSTHGQETEIDRSVTVEKTENANIRLSLSREITPMQESLVVENQNDLSQTKEKASIVTTEPPAEKMQAALNISEKLEYDSNRFDDPEYKKVGQLSGFAVSSRTSMSNIPSDTEGKYHFPSLQSSSPDVRPKMTFDPSSNMISFSESSDLSLQVGNLAGIISTEATPDLAIKFQAMSQEIGKVENDAKKYKKLVETLSQENRRLKTDMNLQLQEKKNEILHLREENRRLLERVKHREHERDNLPQTESMSQTPIQGWVHLEKPEKMPGVYVETYQESSDSTVTDVGTLQAKIRHLEEKNKRLMDANQSWQSKWTDLDEPRKKRIAELETELAARNRDISRLHADEKRQQDLEKMLLTVKSHAQEEENAKEEALQQAHLVNNELTRLKDNFTEIERRFAEVNREKHNLKAEITVLKRNAVNPAGRLSGSSQTMTELQTEIAVLREQLTVFEEDFERERQDRAAAQSSRDDLNKNLEKVICEKAALTERNKVLLHKLSSSEDNLRRTINQNGRLQTQLREKKNELQRQREATAYQQQYQQPVMPQQHLHQAYQQMQTEMVYPVTQPHLRSPSTPPVLPTHSCMLQGHVNQNCMAHTQPLMTGNSPYFLPGQQNVMVGNQQPRNPEHLPGSWTCSGCTYINIPSRTVCELCGTINPYPQRIQGHQQYAFMSVPGQPTDQGLMSRGIYEPPQPLSKGTDVPDSSSDLVSDNGLFH